MRDLIALIVALGLSAGACGGDKRMSAPAANDAASPKSSPEAAAAEVAAPTAEPEPTTAEPTAAEPTTAEPTAAEPTSEAAATEPEKYDEHVGSARGTALVKAFNAVKSGDMAAALAGFAEDVVIARIGDPYAPTITGREAVITALQSAASTMRYFAATPSRLYESGDWIAADAVLFGHHTGELLGRAPTGAVIGVALVLAFHFDEAGEIDRVESYFDGEALRRQIGALSPPPGGKVRLIAAPTDDEPEFTRGPGVPENEAVVRRFEAALADGSLGASWDALVQPNPNFENVNENNRFETRDDYLAHWTRPTELGVKLTPGVRFERLLSVDDRVLTWSTLHGVYGGEGPATVPEGTEITQRVFEIWTLRDGKVKSRKSFSNGLEVLAQLGMLPDAAPTK